MKRTLLFPRRSLWTLVLLGVTYGGFGFAQAPSQTTATAETPNAGELLNKLDLLIEQNARLEEQNRALIEQIQSLRKGVADQAGLKAGPPNKTRAIWSRLHP